MAMMSIVMLPEYLLVFCSSIARSLGLIISHLGSCNRLIGSSLSAIRRILGSLSCRNPLIRR